MTSVSIIVPAYNAARFLGQTVASVLQQSYQDYEVIIVDDGSADNTANIASSFTDPRIRYIHQENKGLSSARNTGIKAATGAFLVFLDADDLLLPSKLSVQVEYLQTNDKVGLVAGGWIYIDQDDNEIGRHEPWSHNPTLDLAALLYVCPFVPNSVMLRRQWMERVGLFDESFRRVEDWDLWLRLADAGCIMEWQPEIVCKYRLHDSNMTRDFVAQKRGYLAVLDKFFYSLSASDPIWRERDGIYAKAHLRGFALEYAAGQVEEAKSDLSAALRLDPQLASDNGRRVRDYLVAAAAGPRVNNAEQFIEEALENLPDELMFLQSSRNEMLAEVEMARFYAAHNEQRWSEARQSFLKAVMKDPGWLTNRGAVRMWLDSILGIRQVETMRRLVGRHPSTRPDIQG